MKDRGSTGHPPCLLINCHQAFLGICQGGLTMTLSSYQEWKQAAPVNEHQRGRSLLAEPGVVPQQMALRGLISGTPIACLGITGKVGLNMLLSTPSPTLVAFSTLPSQTLVRLPAVFAGMHAMSTQLELTLKTSLTLMCCLLTRYFTAGASLHLFEHKSTTSLDVLGGVRLRDHGLFRSLG